MKVFKHKDVNDQFKLLCTALERTPGTAVGQWQLCYRNEHYRIEAETLAGKVYPLGELWRSGRDFVVGSNFALLALNVHTYGDTAQLLEAAKNESSSNQVPKV